MKMLSLIFAHVAFSYLLVSAQEHEGFEISHCYGNAQKEVALYTDEPSDSILLEALEELYVPYSEQDTVYETMDIDILPDFPGGISEFHKLLMLELKLPAISRDTYICSSTAIAFIVQKNGDVTDFKILKDCGLADYIIPIIQSGPCWIPGQLKGVPVAVRFTMPVRLCFR